MLISSNINSISTISWILWKLKGPPPDAVIICKLDEYIYTPHKLLVMPNIFLIYSRSISLTPFKPQAFEILMPKSSIFSKKPLRVRFATHLIQNGTSMCVSQLIWFRKGLQSAFRDSFDLERDFKVRFANHLI